MLTLHKHFCTENLRDNGVTHPCGESKNCGLFLHNVDRLILLVTSWYTIVPKCHRCSLCCSCSWPVLMFVLQCSVGHWDWAADDHICWSHRRCDESVSGTWHQDVCLWSLRCFCQALGHQRRNVPTNLHWPRVRHQCYLCKSHGHSQTALPSRAPPVRFKCWLQWCRHHCVEINISNVTVQNSSSRFI